MDDGAKIFTREFFFSKGNMYLFNANDYCIEIINKSDIIEVDKGEKAMNVSQIKTPMPGVIVKINVKVGDKVKQV